MKICNICLENKQFEAFSKDCHKKDGHRNQCKKCHSENRKLDYKENPEKYKKLQNNYYLKNKEKIKANVKDWVFNNKEKYNNRLKKWANENGEAKSIIQKRYRINNSESIKKYRKENRAYYNAFNSKHRALKTNATPTWLTEFDFEYIKNIYMQAKKLEELDGIKRHVDHIIPLKGENVCGLHVPWNLQILEAIENLKKGNRL